MNSIKREQQKSSKQIQNDVEDHMTHEELIKSLMKDSENFKYDERKDVMFTSFIDFITRYGFRIEEAKVSYAKYRLLRIQDDLTVMLYRDSQELQMFIAGLAFAENLILS